MFPDLSFGARLFIFPLCHSARFLRKKTLQSRFDELRVWESLNFERTVLRTAVYFLAVIMSVICAYFNLIYGVRFSAADNIHWMTSSLISLVSGELPVRCCVSVWRMFTVVISLAVSGMPSWIVSD